MRKILLLLMFASLLSACRTGKTLSGSVRSDSIYIEKLIPYQLPEDSAKIRALLECNKNGKVVLKWLDVSNSNNVQMEFKLDSIGYLLANMSVKHDTLWLPSKKVIVSKKIVVPQYIKKDLNWWEKLRIWLGNIAFIGIGIWFLKLTRNKKDGK